MPRQLEFRDYDPARETLDDALLAEDVYQNTTEAIADNSDFQRALARAFFIPQEPQAREKQRELHELIPTSEVAYINQDGENVVVGVNSKKNTEDYNKTWIHQSLSYRTRGFEFLVTSNYSREYNGPTKNHYGEIAVRDESGLRIADGREALALAAVKFPELKIEVPVSLQPAS